MKVEIPFSKLLGLVILEKVNVKTEGVGNLKLGLEDIILAKGVITLIVLELPVHVTPVTGVIALLVWPYANEHGILAGIEYWELKIIFW